MFEKVIRLNKREVRICIFSSPVLETEKAAVFGFPLTVNRELLELTSEEFGNSVKGSWLKIDWDSNEIRILSDILGGFRVYYHSNGSNITISDDYRYLIRSLGIKPQINNEEYYYWLKHRFTSGKSTFVKGIDKLSPASFLVINNYGVFENSYFRDIARKPNSEKHRREVLKDLNDTCLEIKRQEKKVVLLFSGGKDSCLLLKLLKRNNVKFTPVFFKLKPYSKHALADLIKVRKIAEELNLKLEEIEIDRFELNENFIKEIAERQLFDRHLSILHYCGTNLLAEKYGNEILLINGQSSDSILSFGPSEHSLMSWFRRYMMYKPNVFISKLGLLLLQLKSRKRFALPKTKDEKLFALFDEFKYSRVIDLGVSDNYKDYFNEYIRVKTEHLQSYYAKEMYCKILSFCQGSDNQVVVNSSRYNGVNVVMPFASPKIVYSTINFKDENLEIRRPKYIIDLALEKDFLFDYDSIVINEKSNLLEKYRKQIPIKNDIDDLCLSISERLLDKRYSSIIK